ncbi:MAG: thiamine pyrophosphate-dependent enzyme [Pseudomonadota bacterium]
MEAAIDTQKISMKSLPAFEALASGHRACQGCGEVLAMRLAMKALGERIIVVSATGCMEVITTPYPQTSWLVPWMHVAFENASAVGSGVAGALLALARKGRLAGGDTKIVIMGGDGGTSDIGMQSLSGALERGHDFVYLCFDNEAYMNTGIQRSSATPRCAWTTTCPLGEEQPGKQEAKKDLVGIVEKHHIPYLATATPAYPFDLMNKVRRGAQVKGPAFIHVLAPCPTGWRIPTQEVIKVARLAVQTRDYPLYEVVNGKYILGKAGKNPKPVSEYLKAQGRFKHLSENDLAAIQQEVDERFAQLQWLASRP